MTRIWRRENMSGTTFDSPWKWLLLPGVIIQWFIYMFPRGGIGSVAESTRHSRSPLLTFYYAALFYLACFALIAFAFHRSNNIG